MGISWNEITSRAIAFSKEWCDEKYENGEALESCSEEADNTKDNVNDIDGKENSEEKDLLASNGSNKGILITSEIILTLVVAGGVAGYYFYKKRNKLS